jgi:enoyl-CoA hydratase
MADVLLVHVAERVATITLNRPESRNALNSELLVALAGALRRVDGDDGVDVVILTGADPAFCAGLDLKELGSTGSNLAEATADPGDPSSGPGEGRRRGPFPPMATPLIGAVNGVAVTGGLELALNCDFLVASERARFGDTHARVGVHPGWGLAVLLPQAVGVRRAREMSFTGNFVDAGEALRLGLVNHVVAHDDLLPFTTGLAADIVSGDMGLVRRLRQTYAEVADAPGAEGWDAEARGVAQWQGRGFDPADVERRRRGVMERGRAQR